MKYLMYFFAPAALFYLLVVPMIAATYPGEHGMVGVAFGAFMLVQLFAIIIDLAWDTISVFYKLEGKSARNIGARLLRRLPTNRPHSRRRPSDIALIITMFLSFLLFNYAFGILYVYVSSIDQEAFNVALTPFTGVYFSAVTAATVGYGDVFPKSVIARTLAMIQIYISLFYVVILFSACSSHLRDRKIDESRQRDSGV